MLVKIKTTIIYDFMNRNKFWLLLAIVFISFLPYLYVDYHKDSALNRSIIDIGINDTNFSAATLHNSTGVINGNLSSFVETKGNQIEGFESIAGWSARENYKLWCPCTNVSTGLNSTFHKEGSYGLSVTSVNGTVADIRKITFDVNMANMKNIDFWLYVDNPDNLIKYGFMISSTTDFSKYFEVYGFNFIKGWNHMVIPLKSFSNVGGDEWNVTKSIQIRTESYPGTTANVVFDDMNFNGIARPKVIINFDDAWQSVYDNASSILSNNNQRATVYTITGFVNTANYMNLTELIILYNMGWDISSHTVHHVRLTNLDAATLNSELNDSRDWLIDKGFLRSYKFFAYPFGQYNDTVVAAVQNSGYVFARTINVTGNAASQAHYSLSDGDILYKMKKFTVSNTTTIESVKAEIDKSIDSGALLILLFHQIVDVDADTNDKVLTSDFKVISDYLASRSEDIDVITISDYYDHLAPPAEREDYSH